jgi:hypothetical protein
MSAKAKMRMPEFLTSVPGHPWPASIPKWGWIALGSILLLGAAGVTYYQAVYLPDQTSSEPALQTAIARQGDLVIYASGSSTNNQNNGGSNFQGRSPDGFTGGGQAAGRASAVRILRLSKLRLPRHFAHRAAGLASETA